MCVRYACLIITLAVSGPTYAGQPSTTDAALDAVERRLEMSRHQRFVALRSAPGSTLAEFTTDGCSGGLSAGWEYLAGKLPAFHAKHGERPPWEECCVAHDRPYHVGGASNATAADSFEARKAADLALKECVLSVGTAHAPELSAQYELSTEKVERLYRVVANLMHQAVRIGGLPCTVLPWRWGYGWPRVP